MAKTASRIGNNPLDFIGSETASFLDLVGDPPASAVGIEPAPAAADPEIERRCHELERANSELRDRIALFEKWANQLKASYRQDVRGAGVQGVMAGFILSIFFVGLALLVAL